MSIDLNRLESNDRLKKFFDEKNAFFNNYFGNLNINDNYSCIYINYNKISDFIDLLSEAFEEKIFINKVHLFGNEYYTITNIRYIINYMNVLIYVTNSDPLETIKNLELNVKQTYYNFEKQKMYYVGESSELEFSIEELNNNYKFKINNKEVDIIFNDKLKNVIFNNVVQNNLENFLRIYNKEIIFNIELDTQINKYPNNLLGATIINYYFKKYNIQNFKILNDLTEGEYYKDEEIIKLILLKKDILEIDKDDLEIFDNYVNNIKNKKLKNNAENFKIKLLNAIKIIQ